MDRIVFSHYSVQDVLIAAGVVIILLTLWGKLEKFFRIKKDSEYMQLVRCRSCGWKGRVSRYAGSCPSCNQPLGDRKSKPYS
jgi:hypothetical protein